VRDAVAHRSRAKYAHGANIVEHHLISSDSG
jgi:hypothetical protein